jgi:hypothetical protein
MRKKGLGTWNPQQCFVFFHDDDRHGISCPKQPWHFSGMSQFLTFANAGWPTMQPTAATVVRMKSDLMLNWQRMAEILASSGQSG